MITSASNEWAFVELCVDEVDRKIRSSIEEMGNMFENVFFSGGVDGIGGNLRLVEIAECSVGSASGAAVFIDEWKVSWIFSFEEGANERINFGTKINVTREVGFGGVGFFIRVERA